MSFQPSVNTTSAAAATHHAPIGQHVHELAGVDRVNVVLLPPAGSLDDARRGLNDVVPVCAQIAQNAGISLLEQQARTKAHQSLALA